MGGSYFDEELRRAQQCAQQYGEISGPVFAVVVIGLVSVGALVLAMLYLERSLG